MLYQRIPLSSFSIVFRLLHPFIKTVTFNAVTPATIADAVEVAIIADVDAAIPTLIPSECYRTCSNTIC